jgi:glycine cleavage system protein P-like pyridoxal-binding family
MMSHGADGLRQASGDAVLNANYLLACLSDELTPAFDGPCMHEVLFDDRFLKDTGVTTLDFAKALIDEGFHPMTMYFPLVVHGALLMEPTETESKDGLDLFIGTVTALAKRAKTGDTAFFRAGAETDATAPARRDHRRPPARSYAGDPSRNRMSQRSSFSLTIPWLGGGFSRLAFTRIFPAEKVRSSDPHSGGLGPSQTESRAMAKSGP